MLRTFGFLQLRADFVEKLSGAAALTYYLG
jgi:hypothetical protein